MSEQVPTSPEAENAATIADIPLEELSDDEARGELFRRALDGQDVYAYIPVASETHTLWVRQPDPAIESRFVPMEWAAEWHAGRQPELKDHSE